MQAQTQLESTPGTAVEETESGPRWNIAKRIGFRFVFAYFFLHIFPFPVELLPFTTTAMEKYNQLWQTIVPWVGKHLLRLSYDITIFTNGSGDTTYDYVKALCFLVIAAAATIVWSLLDRKRPSYERLHQWFRLYVRFSLAAAMIGYGAYKVIPIQMPAPFLTRLITPYGESSPMGLLWTFIGASKGFEIFTGAAEMLAGVLLIVPRTMLLGALICFANTTFIFVLNMCYDVPVKLYSFHLVLMSLFLLAPDLKRLANLFLFNRAVEAVTPPQLFKRSWLNRSALALQLLFGLFLVGWSLNEAHKQSKLYGDNAPKPPLYGIWEVDEYSVDGQVRPPLLTDAARWRRVIFQFPEVLAIQPMSGPNQRFTLKLNTEDQTLSLGKPNDESWKADFTFKEPEPGQMTLEGVFEGQKLSARLTRFDETKFLLTSRGFRWIQEYPFNR